MHPPLEEEQGHPATMETDAEIPEEGDDTKTSHRKEVRQPGRGSDKDSAERMTHRATFHEEEGELGTRKRMINQEVKRTRTMGS